MAQDRRTPVISASVTPTVMQVIETEMEHLRKANPDVEISRFRDSKSLINRPMRSACSPMISRNFSRARASSLAGPRRVSMKPANEASGVFNSWLALATKSER